MGGGGEDEHSTHPPDNGVHGSGKQDEDLRVEEGEVVEAILPADDGTHHEEACTAEEDHHKEDDDFGMR